RIALSGLLPVEFRDFFIADELNSMAFSIWMITYFFCVYSWHWNDLDNHCNVPKMWVTPLLACLPPLSRGLQCLRRYHDSKEVHHLVNGLKYVTSILATVFAGIRRISPSPGIEITWVLLSIINSTYTSIWDIKMDWGLLDVKSSHFLLRDDLVFYKWTYYTAIPLNIMLRFAWAINKASLAYHSEILAFGTAILEVFRRIVWNFFRLENEHLNNCGNYRAIKEIPLPFALKETYKMDPNEQEEGTIYLPPDQEETRSNNNSAVLPVITPDLSDTLVKPSDLVSSNVGSFYGRRDFETRQDKEDDHKLGLPVRQPSMVGQVLERIRTLGTPEESDSEIDDDDSDS
ncbi:EXS family-domain-containing protein, partial [Halteromyces radiatus]|uniref:EXS family-domain-containing protein n=1 Tax=Halteromyces radiatus TaxID=101107 RepID=UPI00221F45EE